MTITNDLAKFGARERLIFIEILQAWNKDGLPRKFYDSNVSVMLNHDSGCVFLTNSEDQTAMMNGDKLELYYTCGNCGHEGFADEMQHNEDDEGCQEYLEDIELANSNLED